MPDAFKYSTRCCHSFMAHNVRHTVNTSQRSAVHPAPDNPLMKPTHTIGERIRARREELDIKPADLLPSYEVFMTPVLGEPPDDDPAENALREDFCRAMGWHPTTHFTLRIQGDSMVEAGLRDGWTVVVDTRPVDIQDGSIYAIREHGKGVVCRYLEATGDGGLRIISANSAHPLYRTPRVLGPLQAEHITVLGLVVHAQGLLSRSR